MEISILDRCRQASMILLCNPPDIFQPKPMLFGSPGCLPFPGTIILCADAEDAPVIFHHDVECRFRYIRQGIQGIFKQVAQNHIDIKNGDSQMLRNLDFPEDINA